MIEAVLVAVGWRAAREPAGRIALSLTPDEQKRRFAKVCEKLVVVQASAANDG